MREVKPTQKPVPSSDVKDLFFNSGKIDEWVNSLQHEYTDRFGKCHKTAAGMEWIFNKLVERFKIESEQALLAAGYAPAGTFQEGAEVVNRNGTVLWKLPDGDGDHYRWDGDLPKPVPVGSTPESTGGIGKGAWVSVGDASLRGDIGRVIKTYSTVNEMKADSTRQVGMIVETLGYHSENDGGGARYVLVDSITADGYLNHNSVNGGVFKLVWGENGLLLSKAGITKSSTADHNTKAINEAINQANANGGAVLYVPSDKVHDFNGQIIQKETVRLRGVAGVDRGLASVRYVGNTFQDFIVNQTGHRNYMSLDDLMIFGGEYQKGRARYPVHYTGFNTACWIKNCWIRDGLGLLRIDSGYYCQLENVVCQRVTPSQTSPDIPFTNGEFGQVYSGTNSPVYLGEMNSCIIDALQLSYTVSEAITAAEPVASLTIIGEGTQVNGLRMERIGTAYSGFNPKVQNALVTNGIVNFNTYYLEGVYVSSDIFRSIGFSRFTMSGINIYDVKAQTLARNLGIGDMSFKSGQVWRADIERLDYTPLDTEGNGARVYFDSVSLASGMTSTLMDTFGSKYPHGCTDGPVRTPLLSGEYVSFPKIITGLEIIPGFDSNGAKLNIKTGSILNQSHNKIDFKVALKSGALIAEQVLRPQTANADYKLFIGKAGNLYIREVSGDELSDVRGNWLAKFKMDASAHITDVTPNPRLSIIGNYRNGTDNAVIEWVSNTAPALELLRNLDSVDNLSGTSGRPMGWIRNNNQLIAKPNYP